MSFSFWVLQFSICRNGHPVYDMKLEIKNCLEQQIWCRPLHVERFEQKVFYLRCTKGNIKKVNWINVDMTLKVRFLHGPFLWSFRQLTVFGFRSNFFATRSTARLPPFGHRFAFCVVSFFQKTLMTLGSGSDSFSSSFKAKLTCTCSCWLVLHRIVVWNSFKKWKQKERNFFWLLSENYCSRFTM